MSIFKKDKEKKPGSRRIGGSSKDGKSKSSGKSKSKSKDKKSKKRNKWSIRRGNRNTGAVCPTPSAISDHPITTPNVRHASKNPESEKELGLHSHSHEKEQTKEQKIQYQIGDNYRYLSDIGAGAFGTVIKAEKVRGADEPEPAKDAKVQPKYAIKMAGNLFSSRAKAKRFLREVRILRLLSAHESIVEMSDIVPPRDGLKFTQLSMVFEFMPADLKRIFRSKQYFSNLHIEYIMYQILLGLKFVHTAGIVHRDLKPENIIINEECTIRVIDFGLARGVKENIEQKQADISDTISDASKMALGDAFVEAEILIEDAAAAADDAEAEEGGGDEKAAEKKAEAAEEESEEKKAEMQKRLAKTAALTKHVVTRWYRSPEVILLQQERQHLYGVDVWSVGCIFAELLNMHKDNARGPKERKPLFPGRTCFPFSTKNNADYLQETDQLRVVFDLMGTPSNDEIAKFKDQNVRTYLRNMNNTQPKDLARKFPATNEHGTKLLADMLKFDVTKRISVEEALQSPYFKNVRDDAAEAKHPGKESFEFEDIDIDEQTLRALILEEIMHFNPEWKKQLTKQYREKRQKLQEIQKQQKAKQ